MIDFVARIAQGQDGVAAGMLAAAGNDDLRGLVGQAVVALEFVRRRLAQFRDAAAGRVFGEAVVAAP